MPDSLARLKERVEEIGAEEALRRINAFIDPAKDDWTEDDWEDFYRVANPVMEYTSPSERNKKETES